MRLQPLTPGETMIGTVQNVQKALEANGAEVLRGKGGFWIKGKGFITLAQARKQTGIDAPKRRTRGRQLPWGDYATIAAINGVRQ